MAESAAINKSLSTLGQVVHALNKGHVRPHRPFLLCIQISFLAEPYTLPKL